jgi:Rieske Fe-S protein
MLVPEQVRTAFMTSRRAVRGSVPAVGGSRARRRRIAAREAARGAGGVTPVGFSPYLSGGDHRLEPGEATIPSPERRLVLQTGALAAIAAIVSSLALPLRALGVLTGPRVPVGSPRDSGGPTPSGAGQTPSPTAPAGAKAITTVAAVQKTGAAAFTVPFDAAAPLPAGDPGVIVQLSDGSFVAFDAVCTHQGCTVEWDRADAVLICPCHEAVFDPANDAAVLQGPARLPLPKLPIVIDAASGSIYLSA